MKEKHGPDLRLFQRERKREEKKSRARSATQHTSPIINLIFSSSFWPFLYPSFLIRRSALFFFFFFLFLVGANMQKKKMLIPCARKEEEEKDNRHHIERERHMMAERERLRFIYKLSYFFFLLFLARAMGLSLSLHSRHDDENGRERTNERSFVRFFFAFVLYVIIYRRERETGPARPSHHHPVRAAHSPLQFFFYSIAFLNMYITEREKKKPFLFFFLCVVFFFLFSLSPGLPSLIKPSYGNPAFCCPALSNMAAS